MKYQGLDGLVMFRLFSKAVVDGGGMRVQMVQAE